MPEQDLQRIVGEAVDARDKFLQWSRDNYPQLVELSKNKTLRDRMAESPSKKLLRGTLLTLGLSTLGVAAIADKLNIDLEGSLLFSYGTFIAPVLEELVFRSKKIPHFISKVGDVIGLPIRSDQARITNNMLFALGHIIPMFDAKKNAYQVLNAYGLGTVFQKTSHERGMAASIALHSIWNATTILKNFLIMDLDRHKMDNERSKKEFIVASKINTSIRFATLVGIGIIGLKELMEDREFQLLRDRLQNTTDKMDISDFVKVNDASKKLLSMPSVDGYKFETGVELAYMGAALSMPSSLINLMTPDEYARSQVHQMVMNSWKDPKTLPHRLEKANTYITEQIAKRKLYPA
ncbi:MAG TPA: CPBP family intramembrane glutamic endopeptidase [Patescibacteria group bacterium]|nr:CPBP family intramembrane glutamic endopeptidase [Patescibacteria group bacterium]